MEKIKVNLPVSFLKEGNKFVAYTPVLDISTSGKTFKEAQKRFSELVEIFFEELIEMGTLGYFLKRIS
jgi:predicted RNase H-like HicB family nuclease